MSEQHWFRREVLSLPAYVPGKEGMGPDVVKLASNETPFSALPAVQAVVAAEAGSLNRYPDMFATGLISDIARFHEWADDGIVVGNGSTSLIEQFLRAVVTPGGEVVLPWRSFEAYPIAIQAAGGRQVPAPLRSGAHDLEGMLGAITSDTRAVLLCSPNNPTGVALAHTELSEFLAQVPERVPVLLDEAYIDFLLTRKGERLDVRALPNVLLLRSLTKTYHLSGARIGYVLAGEGWIRRLGSRQPTWSVNAFAQALALAFMEDEGFLARLRTHYAEETPRLVRAVEAAGFRVRPSCVHYFLMETEDDEALIRGLMERGIVVRHTRNFPGIEGRCVRIATRTCQEDRRLAGALRELRERGVCR